MSNAVKLYPFLLHKFLFQKEAIVLITQFDPWDVSDPKALIRAFGKVMDLWYQLPLLLYNILLLFITYVTEYFGWRWKYCMLL